jgi:hypothetical protein
MMVDWQDWITDALTSLPFDQRLEILIGSIRHNSLASLIAARDLPIATRFVHAEHLRDVADRLERV